MAIRPERDAFRSDLAVDGADSETSNPGLKLAAKDVEWLMVSLALGSFFTLDPLNLQIFEK
jgi:hypothetical protein